MTWVYGTTTWGSLLNKLVALACGEVADDQSVTVQSSDRWRRVVAGDNVIAAHTSEDVIVTQQHRAGYWFRYDDTCLYADGSGGRKTFCRQTAMWSAFDGAWKETLAVFIRVNTANSVASNYSTAQIQYSIQSIDAAGVTTHSSHITTTPNAAGDVTITLNTRTMTINLGDPGGFLKVGACFERVFTSAFKGGIDYWRGAGRNVDGVVTQNTALPGVNNTDYVLNVGPNAFCSPGAWQYSTNSSYNEYRTSTGGSSVSRPQVSTPGVGYKTNVSLTGAIYNITFKRADSIKRLLLSSNTLQWVWGGTGLDAPATTRRYGVEGSPANTPMVFCRPFTGSPTSGALVQYWMSVKNDRLVILLNGDTTIGSGIFAFNASIKVVPDEPSFDSGCWAVGGTLGSTINSWIRLGAHSISEKVSQNAYMDDGRDWQTGSGRGEPTGVIHEWGSSLFNGFAGPNESLAMDFLSINGPVKSNTISQMGLIGYSTNRTTNPLLGDPRWMMLKYQLKDVVYTASDAETGSGQAGKERPRGFLVGGLFYTASGGFGTGDILTDTSTGKTYFLILIDTTMNGTSGWVYTVSPSSGAQAIEMV